MNEEFNIDKEIQQINNIDNHNSETQLMNKHFLDFIR